MKIDRELQKLYYQISIIGISIIIYFIFLKYKFKQNAIYVDPLNKKIFYIPFYGKISAWPISHIITYGIFTYLYPQYWYHIFFIGIIWEIIEYIFKVLLTKKGDKLKFKRTRNSENEIEYTTWWDSSTQDIIWNSIGQIIGISLVYINL